MCGPMPRTAPPSAQSSSPAISVRTAPNREISTEPAMAAPANNTIGMPERIPIWVFERLRSRWISGMTGGTARMVRRSALPASQSSNNAVTKPIAGAAMCRQAARRRGTLTTVIKARMAVTASVRNTARGSPRSISAPQISGETMPAMLKPLVTNPNTLP